MTELIAPYGPLAYFLDLDPPTSTFLADAKSGLSGSPKSISPKYFYDERGSALFDEITSLKEYYPTRVERRVFEQNAEAISEAIGARAGILEYGSGSSEKIRGLLGMLRDPVSYVAMDISRDHLIGNASALAADIDLPVGAICADFTKALDVPRDHLPEPARNLGFFPGSTLGNFTPAGAVAFLENASSTLGPDAYLLLGIDQDKDEAVLHAAYDDASGVTADFNLNLLKRMQDELGATLDIGAFRHEARVERDPARVEMHLVAKRDTAIDLDGEIYTFAEGESLHTENSHKFTKMSLSKVLEDGPWRLAQWWTDDKDWFAACLLCNK